MSVVTSVSLARWIRLSWWIEATGATTTLRRSRIHHAKGAPAPGVVLVATWRPGWNPYGARMPSGCGTGVALIVSRCKRDCRDRGAYQVNPRVHLPLIR